MHYNPEDAVYIIRAQAHTSVMRTVHDKHVVGKRRNVGDTLVIAMLLPIFLAASVLLYEQVQLQSDEQYHMAAPEEPVAQEVEVPDESAEDQQAMMEDVCNAVCWDERISESKDKLVLVNFCTDVCGIPYSEPAVEPEQPVIIEETDVSPEPVDQPLELREQESAVPTIDSIKEDAEIIESSLEIVEKTLEKIPHRHIGMYLTQNSVSNETKLKDTFDKTKSVGGNAIVFDVKGSFVYFDAGSSIAKELGTVRPVYDLKQIVSQARNEGFYVIARYIAAKDPELATRVPTTQIQNTFTNTGIGNVWVTPNHSDVLAYNKSIIEEVIAAEVNEINFDYIRYPTEYNQDAINLTGKQKADQLMEFLQMARDIVNEKQSGTKIGISTYAILGWNFPLNFEPIGQDITRFSELVDVISPMAYPSTFSPSAYYDPQTHPGPRNYYLVYRTLLGYKELLGDDAWKLRPWIQGYFMTPFGMKSQIRAVHDAGLCGFTVWNAQNNYDDTYKGMEDYEEPEHCR